MANPREGFNNELEIDMIGYARRLYPNELPPFVDLDLSSNVQAGTRREVIRSAESGHWPLPTGSKSELICRAWGNTQHRFWTYDVREFRYIVKGFPAIHDGKTWVVYRIWDGKDHGIGEPNGFGSLRVAFEYRPDIVQEEIALESMFLNRSRRRKALGQREPRQADGNSTFRKMAAMVEQAERDMGRGAKENERQVDKVTNRMVSESPGASQVIGTSSVLARTGSAVRRTATTGTVVAPKEGFGGGNVIQQPQGPGSTNTRHTRSAPRAEVVSRNPFNAASNTLHGQRDSSARFSSCATITRNRNPRKSSKRHREPSLGEELDTNGPITQEKSRKKRQHSTPSMLSHSRIDHNVNEGPSPADSAPQNQHPRRPPVERPLDQQLTPAQTPIPTLVKQGEQASDHDRHPFLPMLPFRSISRSSSTPRSSLEDEVAGLERLTKRYKKELEILKKEREIEEAEERLAAVKAKKTTAAAASQAQSRDKSVIDLTDN